MFFQEEPAKNAKQMSVYFSRQCNLNDFKLALKVFGVDLFRSKYLFADMTGKNYEERAENLIYTAINRCQPELNLCLYLYSIIGVKKSRVVFLK